MPSSGTLRRVAFVRTDVSEERIASIMSVTKFGELGTSIVVTGNRNITKSINHSISGGHSLSLSRIQQLAYFAACFSC
jgi:hypothetical protein